ncbi:hypothetical protein C7S18_09680 [Ahniella affigens]|uniref:SH3 domain-containing protein n=1 Tax=Ahniella affigens TaxID=2021234 RepID=A0A2P1PRH2_9GAMM|nr:hypothetical protein [Ahniella affigens]AVP97450.1 hypothetical protein C7S18_09680 [Ahniella affigens]
MMQIRLLTSCVLLILAGLAHGGEVSCGDLQADAAESATRIDGCMAERAVIGSGRLQFHSAPDRVCTMPGVFVIPGDHLIAYSEFGGFTEVMYLNPKTGNDAMGWVESSRLKETGHGIANCEGE